MKTTTSDAILQTLQSPNVLDSNLETANAVDVLNYIASAIRGTADASKEIAAAIRHHAEEIHALALAVQGRRPIR